jgi:hypothetical protein
LLADKDQDYAYEIQYQPNHQDNNEGTIFYTYDGVVPVPRENPRIVGLGCFGTETKNEKESLVAAVNAMKPVSYIVIIERFLTSRSTSHISYFY